MTATREDTFTEALAAYDARARSAAAGYLASDDMSDYLSDLARDYLGRGGKGLRPALLLATVEAFGGGVDDGVPSAAALELLHTAFLVHDDIEDDSEIRRGEPSLHRRYGLGPAVNAGDGLAVVALGALRDNDSLLGRRLSARVWSEFDFMARQTVDGQARELGWLREGRTDLTPDDYLDLIMKKTCWYTTVTPLRVGALIGSRGRVDLEGFVRFGFALGAAFQIRDDVLNLVGTPGLYGKEPLGDLREGKRTLVLLHLLAAADASDREQVEAWLALAPSDRSPDVVRGLVMLMHRYGSIAFAEHFARGIAASAAEAFEVAFARVPPSPARQFVRDLVPFMVDRDR
jgi:geranylgeranyl diphosphate synthase type II